MASILAAGAAACGNEALAPGGGTTDTLTFDTKLRVFDVYVSDKVERDTPAPLLFVMHQTTPPSDGEQMRELSGFDAVADSLGFIVVYPDAIVDWAEGCDCATSDLGGVDDVGFLLALIDRMEQDWSVDRGRVYAVGFAQGGLFANRLGCDAAQHFAGVAVVAATMSRPLSVACDPSRPMKYALMVGTRDEVFPFWGSSDRGPFTTISAEATLRLWRGLVGCSDLPVVSTVPDTVDDGWTVRVDGYRQCTTDASVVMYTIQGATHVWPKGDMDPALELGEFFLACLEASGSTPTPRSSASWRAAGSTSRPTTRLAASTKSGA
jgi:polyhydroxybutyrate depolymerase